MTVVLDNGVSYQHWIDSVQGTDKEFDVHVHFAGVSAQLLWRPESCGENGSSGGWND